MISGKWSNRLFRQIPGRNFYALTSRACDEGRSLLWTGRGRAAHAATLLLATFRSVMSRATFDAPIIAPRASLTGDTVSDMGMKRPSLVRRTVSK